MTKQEIFNKVKDHLLTQNERSLNDDARCAYRGENNTKCAIGCLIPDELYKPEMDALPSSVFTLYRRYPDVFSEMLGVDSVAPLLPLLNDLQVVHDGDSPDEWPYALHEIAKYHDLEYGDD